MKIIQQVRLIATAAFGLEAVVARQVQELGYQDVQVENGRVRFAADPSAICRSNLWLRSADRLLVEMEEFHAVTFEELFEQTKALPWADWLPADAAFPVTGKSVRSQLHSVPDCQAIVKKAVVESMKKHHHRQWFEETGPAFRIEVALLRDVVTLTLDTSGPGLHKRGYRQLASQAPLKETLAAAMVSLSRWRPDRPFWDPFCGSGTIPIEAALIGRNIAPGLQREFAAEAWPLLPPNLWRAARQEARDLARWDQPLDIGGSDIDEEVLSLARHHARKAGLSAGVRFQHQPVSRLESSGRFGYLVCNPPFGQRLGDIQEAEQIYREMGRSFRALDTWSFYVLSSHEQFERFFGRRADKNRKLYNGRIKCYFYQFFGPRPPRQPAPQE